MVSDSGVQWGLTKQLFARDVLAMKKVEIEKTKPTFIRSVLKVLIETELLLPTDISQFRTEHIQNISTIPNTNQNILQIFKYWLKLTV